MNKDSHSELQRLTGKIESQDKLRAKFYEVFTRSSRINSVSPTIPLAVVAALSIEPILTYMIAPVLNFTIQTHESVQNILTISMTIRIIGLSSFVLLIKRKNKLAQYLIQKMELERPKNSIEEQARLNMHPHYHILTLLFCVLLMGISNSGIISILTGEQCHIWVENQFLLEFVMVAYLLSILQSRFKYEKLLMRKIYIFVVALYNIVYAYLSGESLLIVYCSIGMVINIESIWWRFEFMSNEQEGMQKDFDESAVQLRNEAELKFQQLTDEFEQTSNHFTTTRAEELLTKLRLQKYQSMIRKNDQMRFKLNQKFFPQPVLVNQASSPDRFATVRDIRQQHDENNSDHGSIEEQHQKFTRKPFRQLTTRTEVQNSLSYDSPPNLPNTSVRDEVVSHAEIEFDEENFQLACEDLDDIIKIVQGRREQIWLPQFLRSSKNIGSSKNISQTQFSPEAKSFILDHFTEKEFNFQLHKIEKEHHSPAWTIEIQEQMSGSENNFSFDFFEMCENGQPSVSVFMNYSTFLFLKFSIHRVVQINSNSIMMEFLHQLESLYLNNPYHNSIHAIDVANSAAFFLTNGLGAVVTDFEAACLLVACLAHDVGHPGLNNGFMVASKSKQALLYNDQSVLESYHASLFFHILQDPKANIIQNLSDVDYKGFRKYSLNLILDTDLQKHFLLLTKFKSYIQLGDKNLKDEQNKLLLLSMAIKAADVGHGAKTVKLHKLWSRRIIEEFFIQGDLEAQIGMQVTPMCDRHLSVTKSQEGFLKAICLPLFEAFQEFLQNENLDKTCIQSIQDNIRYWQDQQKEEVLQIICQELNKKPSFFKDTDSVVSVIAKTIKKDINLTSYFKY